MTINDHTNAFIPILWAYVQSISLEKDVYIKKKLREGLSDTIKKMTDQKVTYISKAVLTEAEKQGIDPFDLLWPDRGILGKVNNKSRLVWEHTTPIKEFLKTLETCQNEAAIIDAVANYSGVCWISRDEDNLLNANKCRDKRPGGWMSCYTAYGIDPIPCP